MVSTRGSSSRLESEHQGFANVGIGVWSSNDDDQANWHVHDLVANRSSKSLQRVSRIRKYNRLRLPHQFCEACDEHWKKSLEAWTPWKLDRLWKRSAPCRKMCTNTDKPATTKQLVRRWTRKLVADAVKDELMFMRKLEVYHEVTSSYRDTSGLQPIGTRWVYTNEGDAANPFVRTRLVPQETKRVSSMTAEDASTFAKFWDSTTPAERTFTARGVALL